MRLHELTWLAGLIEGEGCFTVNRSGTRVYPRLIVHMTDFDTIRRAAQLMGVPETLLKIRRPHGHQPTLGFELSGRIAMRWAMVLYPWLGDRRRTKIAELWRLWRDTSRMPGKARGSRVRHHLFN